MEKLEDLDLSGKRVLIRVDFNVPLNEMQKITSNKIKRDKFIIYPSLIYCYKS